MTIEYKDAVRDTTTTTGTGTITLDGVAPSGYVSVAAAHTASASVQYRIETADKTEWENGEGALNAGKTSLTRVTVYASSNSNNLVNFSAGTKTVYTTIISHTLESLSNCIFDSATKTTQIKNNLLIYDPTVDVRTQLKIMSSTDDVKNYSLSPFIIHDVSDNLVVSFRNDGVCKATQYVTLDGITTALVDPALADGSSSEGAAGVQFSNAGFVGWTSTTYHWNTQDLLIYRSGSGILGIGTTKTGIDGEVRCGKLTIGTASPSASAAIQVDSTTQAIIFPRMTTTQKNAISTPVAGMVVYDTTLNKLCVYTTAWQTITSA